VLSVGIPNTTNGAFLKNTSEIFETKAGFHGKRHKKLPETFIIDMDELSRKGVNVELADLD